MTQPYFKGEHAPGQYSEDFLDEDDLPPVPKKTRAQRMRMLLYEIEDCINSSNTLTKHLRDMIKELESMIKKSEYMQQNENARRSIMRQLDILKNSPKMLRLVSESKKAEIEQNSQRTKARKKRKEEMLKSQSAKQT
ncbi:MAG: hypothetical protein V1660_00110 [archaeon]